MHWSKVVENSLGSKSSSTFLKSFKKTDFPSILNPTPSAEIEIKVISIWEAFSKISSVKLSFNLWFFVSILLNNIHLYN